MMTPVAVGPREAHERYAAFGAATNSQVPRPPLILKMAATAQADPLFKKATSRNTRGLLRVIILALIAGAAVSSRLFSVIRFESIIHECESSWTPIAVREGELGRFKVAK
jgi:hypothetical protein